METKRSITIISKKDIFTENVFLNEKHERKIIIKKGFKLLKHLINERIFFF